MGSGLNGNVAAFAVYDGALYAAGYFTSAGRDGLNRIARTGVNGRRSVTG